MFYLYAGMCHTSAPLVPYGPTPHQLAHSTTTLTQCMPWWPPQYCY